MSRRRLLYRDRYGPRPSAEKVAEWILAVLGNHGKALGKMNGKTCSLPMKEAKARRLAGLKENK